MYDWHTFSWQYAHCPVSSYSDGTRVLRPGTPQAPKRPSKQIERKPKCVRHQNLSFVLFALRRMRSWLKIACFARLNPRKASKERPWQVHTWATILLRSYSFHRKSWYIFQYPTLENFNNMNTRHFCEVNLVLASKQKKTSKKIEVSWCGVKVNKNHKKTSLETEAFTRICSHTPGPWFFVMENPSRNIFTVVPPRSTPDFKMQWVKGKIHWPKWCAWPKWSYFLRLLVISPLLTDSILLRNSLPSCCHVVKIP